MYYKLCLCVIDYIMFVKEPSENKVIIIIIIIIFIIIIIITSLFTVFGLLTCIS